MAKRFKVTIRVVTRSPKLQTTTTRQAEAVVFCPQIVAVVALPEPQVNDPKTQLLTPSGPLDCFEDPQEVMTRIERATE